MSVERVAVVGAGVAGLTAALSFARHGIACDIFEEAPELREVGAGLQISPNASRILGELGVLPALEATWVEPERIALVSGTSGRNLAHVPVGEFARQRWGAPYGVLHRATLQGALQAAVRSNPLCSLRLGTPLRCDIRASIKAVANKSYPLIIGADGVWSEVREQVPGAPVASFSGNVAWRFNLPQANVPEWLSLRQVTAYLGPSAHLVAYPLKDTNSINLVAIASGISSANVWDATASDTQHRMLMAQFGRWDRQLLQLLSSAENPTFWPLHHVSTGRWQNGSDIVLIGDAAHAMMPFAAQGAAMAIEDAFALAARVSGATSIAKAISMFEAERTERLARVRARGAFNRFAYHARGPIRLGRDLVLAVKPPQSLAAELDWLYGYRTS
ncbi:salicylate hydroxylase [Pseudorhizobium halotolerans]|uniref:Salicylate hydroxylase n=1 Tax=Pseudorhizobium halotolerans TaxID=1233081 RepID=A0ABN7JPV1_9HYPH|nr:FAD-dependent monooxygenase [Pseudorhizobium halotolerans]CAD7036986.1 salicylate hydroxylase [Pseudorhizobium halotolerans]